MCTPSTYTMYLKKYIVMKLNKSRYKGDSLKVLGGGGEQPERN